ncbi:MAG: hypothetical protein LBE38_04480 [Deltaproteobacteria bacterium]|jgi:hypothetical protein|nr:hypothetical protein [Deltaproteobacteria bacterium]
MDYCEDYTFLEEPLSPLSAFKLFASITFDERMAYFKKWVVRQAPLKLMASVMNVYFSEDLERRQRNELIRTIESFQEILVEA